MKQRFKEAYIYALMATQSMYDKPNVSKYRLIRLALQYASDAESLKVTAADISKALETSLLDLLSIPNETTRT